MTARAGDVGPVLGQPLADRERRGDRVVLERRHVRRGRRWRRAEDVLEDPFAADHGRRAGRVGGHGQDAPLAEQAAPHAVVAELDATELAAVDVRDAVVLGQALVQERVVRLQQVEHAAILAQDVLEQEFRLLAEGLPQVVVEVGEQAQVRGDRLQVAQVQPLAREVGHQAPRARVGQHAEGLSFEHLGFAQLAALRQVEELVVRDAAPEEERQAGRELDVGDAVGRARRDARRVRFDAEEELRVHQHRAQGHLDPRVEVPLRAGLPVQLHRLPEVRVDDRPPVGPAHERAEDPPGTRFLFARFLRLADEDPAAAGRVAVALGVIRPGDRDLVDRRRDAGVPVHVVMGLVGLSLGLQQRGGILQERHAEIVRAGRRPDAGLQVRVGGLMVRLRSGRRHRERRLSLAIQQHLQLMRLAQALDVLVAVARQAELDLVFAVLGERIRDHRPAARPDRQPVDVFLLGEVRPDADRFAAGRSAGVPDRQAADLLRRGDVSVQERRREVAHRHVVEPVAGLVGRQQGRGIDIQRQEVADGVLVFRPVEPTEGVGPAWIGSFGGRAVERAGEQGDEGVVLAPGRSHLLLRRHLASDELPHDPLPGLRVAAHLLRADRVEGQPRRLVVAVMARDAIQIHEPTMASRSFEPPGEVGGAACWRAGPGLHEADDQEQDRHPAEAARSPSIHEAWLRHQGPMNEIDLGGVRVANDRTDRGRCGAPAGRLWVSRHAIQKDSTTVRTRGKLTRRRPIPAISSPGPPMLLRRRPDG